MTSYTCGQRLGVITSDQFQRALDRFDLGAFVDAQPIPFGLFGQNVFVSSDRGEWVLRGVPHFAWQLPTEQWFARLLHEQTSSPVPWPYLHDPDHDIFGWSYAIMPRMPGLQIADPAVAAQLSADDHHGIAIALGKNLAQMQRLTSPVAGRYDPATNSVQPFGTSYGDWIADRIGDLIQSARQHSHRTTDADVQWIESLLKAAHAALNEPRTPCFVMEDYKDANTVVERTNEGWRVSGVFDLMTAHFGDGEADLSRPIALYLERDPSLARPFLHAYLESTTYRSGFAARFPIYMLYDRAIIWEYLERAEQGWNPPVRSFREWAEPYTRAIETHRLLEP